MMSVRAAIVSVILLINIFVPARVLAQEHFNLHALEIDNPGQGTASVNGINEGLEQVPGKYRVAIYINNKYRFTRDVLFSAGDDNRLHPQFKYSDLIDYGVDRRLLEKEKEKILTDSVHNLSILLPGVTESVDLDNLKLTIVIPQKYTDKDERGAVAMRADTGIKAAFVDYDISGSQTHSSQSQGNAPDSYFLGLHNGFNWHVWHLRNTVNISSSGDKRVSVQNNYLERSVPALQSRLTIGESYTASDIFDGVDMRGVQLASEEDMLADNEQGFSPVIRGVASSEAKVTVYRKGYVIYQTYVPAGPFELNKLPAEAGDGEIEVRITTLGGKETTFRYNFSSLPLMQREGISKYTLALGRLTESTIKGAEFIQYTHARGLTNNVTFYGGLLYSGKYKTLTAGIGTSLGSVGALSFDIASAMINGNYSTGGIRSRFYKMFDATGTSLSLTNVFYPDKRFVSIAQAGILSALKEKQREAYNASQASSESRLSLSQQTSAGSLFVSLNDMRYRSKKNNELSLNAGYTLPLRGATLTFNIAMVKHYLKRYNENQFSFLLQVPFNIFSGTMTAGLSLVSSGQQSKVNTAISGNALENNQLSYNLQKSRAVRGPENDAYSLNASYYTSYGLGQLGYAGNANQKQINYGLRGGVVAHSSGITLSQPLGDTFAVVNTSGVSGVYLANSKGIHSDPWGYLIAPGLTPYRKNTLRLLTAENDDSTEIIDPIQTLVPDHGSTDAANFRVRSGVKVLFTVHHAKGFLPFGATVTAGEDGTNSGIAGPEGSVYLSGLKSRGVLTAQWGRAATQTCRAAFDLQDKGSATKKVRIIRKEIECV